MKWAGGKSQLLKQYQPYFPKLDEIGRYFEPFTGSEAVFFHLRPERARLSDINEQLVEDYQVTRSDVDGLISALQPHINDREYITTSDPKAPIPYPQPNAWPV